MYSDACLYRLAEGGRSRGGANGTIKNLPTVWPRGGGRTLLFALVSESVVRISKFAKMTKFLFLALGCVCVCV